MPPVSALRATGANDVLNFAAAPSITGPMSLESTLTRIDVRAH